MFFLSFFVIFVQTIYKFSIFNNKKKVIDEIQEQIPMK